MSLQRGTVSLMATLGLLAGTACTDCRRVEVDQSLEGPAEGTAASVAIISGQPHIVEPGMNKPNGQLILRWRSTRLGTELRFPDLRFGLQGPQDARALGAVLCWCLDGLLDCPSFAESPQQSGVRCVELNGTVDITRYELVETDLGEERDVDLQLEVQGTSGDATVSADLHVVLKDHIVTFECDAFQDPISWHPAPSSPRTDTAEPACLLAAR